MTIRCFLAISLPEDLRDSLENLRSRLDLPQFDVRWVQASNVHLTLRFLGEIPESDLRRISLAAGRAAEVTESFSFRIEELGAFPTLQSPKVVWVGVQPPEPLTHLERRLSKELDQVQWPPPDKPFRPHLTLGRVKSPRGKTELKKVLEKHQKERVGEALATGIELIRSQLRPSGPIYTNLQHFHFRDRAEEANT
ncbi:MAG: RNA 2',3'-cyclic phosphodiesterase [bacterium]